jgi:hypothetical protein
MVRAIASLSLIAPHFQAGCRHVAGTRDKHNVDTA